MPNRVVMRIELTPESKQRLLDLARAKGMTQVAVASRLVEWFTDQPEAVQAMILGQYPRELEADFLRLILEHMEKNDGNKGKRDLPPS